jgi:hypothetical protein
MFELDTISGEFEIMLDEVEDEMTGFEVILTGLEIISGELEAILGRLDTTFQELVNFVAGVVLTFGRTTALVCK